MEILDELTGQRLILPLGATQAEADGWIQGNFGHRGWTREVEEHLGGLIARDDPALLEFIDRLGWRVMG